MLSTAFFWIVDHQDEFFRALGQHLLMSGVSLALALAIGLPLSILIVNYGRFAFGVINIVNGLRTIPSLAILAIMLPLLGDRCLVGRNKRFPPGLYSAFAGFVESGESMEEAVRRELMEEVNLKAGAVRYHASQPWPFPSSLMLGCYAEALSENFRIDENEIEDARWLSKAEARARLTNKIEDEIKLPVTIAIAHHLIKDWVQA